jgi:hypothetical protein
MTMKCQVHLQSVIIYYNPTKHINQFSCVSLFTLIHLQHVAASIVRDIYLGNKYMRNMYVNRLLQPIVTRMNLQCKSYSDYRYAVCSSL